MHIVQFDLLFIQSHNEHNQVNLGTSPVEPHHAAIHINITVSKSESIPHIAEEFLPDVSPQFS